MSYQLCIFDLDGTLADTAESIAYSANRTLALFGLPANPTENYKRYAGDGAGEMLKRSLRDAGDTQLEYFEQAFAEYKKFFAQDCMYHVKPYDGIVEALAGLKKMGVHIAVLSNKPHPRTMDVVETLFGKGYFDYIQGMTDETTRKPNPQGAWKLAKMAGLAPKQCMYVGDTNTDMITGNRAGMFTIGAAWGFRTKQELAENHAHVIIDSPLELLKLVEMT